MQRNEPPQMDDFRVEQVDHIELFVPSRLEAAEWYGRVLGLKVLSEYAQWAEDPGGPLMISCDDGNTKLALFRGQPQGSRETAGFHLVAFRVSPAGFVAFLRRLPGLDLSDHKGRTVTAELVADHGRAYSIYFSDPYGHRLEVTTYGYEATRSALRTLSA